MLAMETQVIAGIAALLIGVILIAIVIPMRLRKNRSQRQIDNQRQRHDIIKNREATDGLMVEMAELGRQITSQIDNKISVLKELLSQADATISRLEQLQKKSPPPTSTETIIETKKKISPKSQPTELQKNIYQLADEGYDAKEISEKLSQRHGEVELILGLRKRDPKNI